MIKGRVNKGNGTAQVRNLLDTAENKDLLKEDLLENDIIMFLISNYDVKLDNFIPRGDHLIPIDFGNARAEDPLSCDVVSGIDMIAKPKRNMTLVDMQVRSCEIDLKEGNIFQLNLSVKKT